MTPREIPIIFQAPMVRAILDGRKSLTRRVVKGLPGPQDLHNGRPIMDWPLSGFRDLKDGIATFEIQSAADDTDKIQIKCPYKVGAKLWIKETWACEKYSNIDGGEGWRDWTLEYRADGEPSSNGAWRSSIHMPRWASRIQLTVLAIRCERLQDITEEDAIAEGVEGIEPGEIFFNFIRLWNSINSAPKPIYRSALTYDSLHGLRNINHYVSYPWEDIQETREHRGKPWYVYGNPWVWPITFERCAGVSQ